LRNDAAHRGDPDQHVTVRCICAFCDLAGMIVASWEPDRTKIIVREMTAHFKQAGGQA